MESFTFAIQTSWLKTNVFFSLVASLLKCISDKNRADLGTNCIVNTNRCMNHTEMSTLHFVQLTWRFRKARPAGCAVRKVSLISVLIYGACAARCLHVSTTVTRPTTIASLRSCYIVVTPGGTCLTRKTCGKNDNKVIDELSWMTLLSMSSRGSVDRRAARCSGSHELDSCQELWIFLCPMLGLFWSVHFLDNKVIRNFRNDRDHQNRHYDSPVPSLYVPGRHSYCLPALQTVPGSQGKHFSGHH